MPDIISAKCFGCGHVVKVPSALGGKKARCPKCTNTITIPSLSDTSDDLVGDEMLPEVARDGDEVEGEYVDEESGSPTSGTESRRGTSFRKGSSPRNPRAGGGRNAGGRNTGSRGPAPQKKSSTGLVVGIVVGVLVLVLVLAMAAGKKDEPKGKQHGKEKDKSAAAPPSTESAEDADLGRRCIYYVNALNAASPDVNTLMKYYAYEPDDERAVRRAISQLVESGTKFENPVVKSASAATGAVTFAYAGGEKTLTWKKVDGQWLIAQKP